MMNVNAATNIELDAHIGRIDRKQVSAIDYGEFLRRKLPPRRALLAPWLPMAGLAMIHAPRGIGKTHIALGTAWAVATGTGFLRWKVPEDVGAYRVLLLDGEMPGAVLQQRLDRVVKASGHTPPLADYLQIAASDLTRDGLPDLADPAAQERYADIIGDADLIVVDNLTTLCRGLKENEADSWTPVQNWLLAQRRQGKSVLVIHHGGKSGAQRGTSRKEDVLDTVIGLRKPPITNPNKALDLKSTSRSTAGSGALRPSRWRSSSSATNGRNPRSSPVTIFRRSTPCGNKVSRSATLPTAPASRNRRCSAGLRGANDDGTQVSRGTAPRRVPWDSAPNPLFRFGEQQG